MAKPQTLSLSLKSSLLGYSASSSKVSAPSIDDVTKELRMAEANHWTSKLNDTSSGSKEFWNVVKLLTGKSPKSKPIGPIMNEQKEDTFNVFFSTFGKELAESFIPMEVNIDPTFYKITPSNR